MAIKITYVTGDPQGDYFIFAGPPWGAWARSTSGHAPMCFTDEADAKRFLAANGYDLPPLKVVFEQVA